MKAAKAFRGLTCILSLLLAISIGLTSGMFSAEGHINRFLGIETTVLVPKAEGVGQASSARYPSSFSADIAHYTAEEKDAKSKAADEFIEWEIEESAVLLRNNNHALPLTKEEMGRVSLFGRATVDPYFKSQSGGGEGGAGEHVDYLAALGERGFTVNETLLNAYRADQSPKTTYEHLGESPASVYTDDVLASFKDTEVAIVMFSRMAGESHDLLPEYKDSDGAIIGMLELSANERDMMTLVKKYKDSGCFKKIIVLLNTSNAMEVDWLDTQKGFAACDGNVAIPPLVEHCQRFCPCLIRTVISTLAGIAAHGTHHAIGVARFGHEYGQVVVLFNQWKQHRTSPHQLEQVEYCKAKRNQRCKRNFADDGNIRLALLAVSPAPNCLRFGCA